MRLRTFVKAKLAWFFVEYFGIQLFEETRAGRSTGDGKPGVKTFRE